MFSSTVALMTEVNSGVAGSLLLPTWACDNNTSEKAAQLEKDPAQQRFNRLERELDMKRKNGLLTDELAEQEKQAKMELIDADNALALVTLENEKQRSELKQDRLERDLDILIDGFDNVKTINEKNFLFIPSIDQRFEK